MASTLKAKDANAVLVLQGAITLLFGVAVVFWPSLTLSVLVHLFGAYILVSGIAHVFYGLNKAAGDNWWALIGLLGLVELGFGVYALRHPLETFSVFIALLGFILIIRGIVQLVGALLDTQSDDMGRGVTVLSGLFAAVVGIIVLNQKVAAGIAFVWLLGVYAIVVGVLELMTARNLQEK
jgi:uncharacterized membrane protein HdeD (DUF308 family)